MPTGDRVFTLRQTCRHLRISEDELRRLVDSRRFDRRAFAPPFTQRGRTYFREAEINAWLAYRKALAARLSA